MPVEVETGVPPAFGVTMMPTPGNRTGPAPVVPRMVHGGAVACPAESARVDVAKGNTN